MYLLQMLLSSPPSKILVAENIAERFAASLAPPVVAAFAGKEPGRSFSVMATKCGLLLIAQALL